MLVSMLTRTMNMTKHYDRFFFVATRLHDTLSMQLMKRKQMMLTLGLMLMVMLVCLAWYDDDDQGLYSVRLCG